MCLSICYQSISVKYVGTKALDILNKPHFFSSVFLSRVLWVTVPFTPFSQLSRKRHKAVKAYVNYTNHALKPWLYIECSVGLNKHIKFNQNKQNINEGEN